MTTGQDDLDGLALLGSISNSGPRSGTENFLILLRTGDQDIAVVDDISISHQIGLRWENDVASAVSSMSWVVRRMDYDSARSLKTQELIAAEDHVGLLVGPNAISVMELLWLLLQEKKQKSGLLLKRDTLPCSSERDLHRFLLSEECSLLRTRGLFGLFCLRTAHLAVHVGHCEIEWVVGLEELEVLVQGCSTVESLHAKLLQLFD